MAVEARLRSETSPLDFEHDDPSELFGSDAPEVETMFRGSSDLEAVRTSEREEPVAAVLAVPVVASARALEVQANAVAGDWTKTLTLVERAAATIRAYEKRFTQLEKQTKGLADRAVEDQRRLQLHIRSLEERLKQAEERTATAETAARDAEYHEWEAETRAKRAEQQAEEAEERTRQAETYLRRVHELLSNV